LLTNNVQHVLSYLTMSTRAGVDTRSRSQPLDETGGDEDNMSEAYIEILANMDESSAPTARKTNRTNFCWTEDSEKDLIAVAVKKEAHHKTKGTNMEDKWILVKAELMTMERFKNLLSDVKWETLRAKFNRMLAEVEAKYAVSAEGANLSGLPEQKSDRDEMLLGILESVAEESAHRDAIKAREQKKQDQMYTHEKNILKRQSNLLPSGPSSENLESTPIESSSNHASSSSGSGGSGKRQRVEPSPLQNQYLFDNQQIVDLLKGNEDADNMAIKEREFELERKRMELDMSMKEREEALQLQRVLVESAKAQTELMREFISRLK
jgi:hypothetical protein